MQERNKYVYSTYLKNFNIPVSIKNPLNQTSSNIPFTNQTENQNLLLASQEDYHDFSMMTDQDVLKCNLQHKSKIGVPKDPFPVKLYSILEFSERDGYSSIISWLPHGRAFKVHEEKLFVEKVIPRFFFQSKMSSFQRQVRMYGFNKISYSAEVDKGAYYNECFLRGRPGLARAIMRLKKPCPLYKPDDINLYLYPPMPSSGSDNVKTNTHIANKDAPRLIHYSAPNQEGKKCVSEGRSPKVPFLPFTSTSSRHLMNNE